ncbi:Zinc finger protein 524 [Larimichthys crocea]|uniref:Uncharacterized protein n=1 Tax=Larimichthys crocea TaxID=215358 RepID=A0ACD3QTU3_LARCR|nr:Zinc finger protein 524 [Larimichthys crocea]
MDLKSYKRFVEVEMEEQTEPLDLSLPKKRESRERRCGRFLDDFGCESSLIMEVDEYEGEGDRDIVEEDNEGDEDSLLSPSFFSTSVFTSLSSIEGDTENLLLIDDQGIPYTLSPDGVKVPQVDPASEDHPSDQAYPAEVERRGSPRLASIAESSLSQSLDNALNAPSDDLYPSPPPATDSPSLGADQTKTPEVFTNLIANPDPSKAVEPSVKSVQPNAVLSPSSGISVPTQPIQILTNPSTNAPFLLLSSPLFLPSALLSTDGSHASSFTPCSSSFHLYPLPPVTLPLPPPPIAVLDPSTGQLSQITAASAPVSLPLPSGQVSTLGSPLPTLSHPVIRLSPNNPPIILSGVNNVNAGSVLTSLAVRSSSPALQNDHHSTQTPLLHPQISSPDSNSGNEAISAEEVSNENNKPSTFTASSPHPQSATLTCDPLAQPSAETQSPASEPQVLYCQLCPRVFFYLSDLERHAITHSQKKPHVCQQCGKAFKRSSHLQRHKHIHTGQRNFVCPICAKRFREAGELQRHQRVHTGEKPYQCQLCHTRFAERNTLRRHTKRKHPYHQVAMEMLNERRGDGGGGAGSGSGVKEEEESAEWYNSTVSNLDNSESEVET